VSAASGFISSAVLRERTHPGPGFIEPCLPSPAKAPPSGPGVEINDLQAGAASKNKAKVTAPRRSPPLRSLPIEQPVTEGNTKPVSQSMCDALVALAGEIGLIDQRASVRGARRKREAA
jgi:hypothetical protein